MSSLSATAASASRPQHNPLAAIQSHLIRRLVDLYVPPAHAIAEVPDLIREAANIFDEWLYAVGNHVGERVNVDLDMRNFQGACLGAVEGNATYEIESAIEDSRRFRTLRRAV